MLFSIEVIPFWIFTSSVQEFRFSTSSATSVFCFLDNNYSDRCKVISYCLDLNISDD